MLIFELSKAHRQAVAQSPKLTENQYELPERYQRKIAPKLPACSELQVVRHYTRLSHKNYSIDSNFYPLGSCTMKYNPRGVHKAASLSGFLNRHPLTPQAGSQGFLQALYELQEYIMEITGMSAVSLTPMAGSQGEFAGVAMIKAYHQSRGDSARDEMLIPDAAHGTNPASAVMCGFKVVEIPTASDGDIDLEVLKQKVGPKTAGIMLTNPSTLGLFMRQIKDIAAIVHQAGGLLYYDGANLNAILGKVRPGDMGFDVMHLNLHKTFATPHGGGGPGAGPVAVGKRLSPFLPLPVVKKNDGHYCWASKADYPQSIGRLSCFMGNAGILLRAYFYIKILGKEGLSRVSQYATLNANYLMDQLVKAGFKVAYPGRRASHEFILTLSPEKKAYQVTAMDIAKRLLDFGFHAPTTYFPLLVPECFLIEPTETESKEELDGFVSAMQAIRNEAKDKAEVIKEAPHTLPVRRLDDVKAARELDLNFYQDK
ncbi:aminomethyl-transferring glycine dehydrogenase subunit GcvPB [Legionella israelensis]|uniref:Probable glycine dehydrogenase (decarboxylating) subunit 2 n=1 Tax=Legionella israelensis TaxID=454 RepID=A0A0W0WJT7_9GAMM|nr:aminomethyl-transferring glycine dehydrogenase subunit GcvPB [Legionella israelensis]KTD32589.1 glycine dehydrogenase [Legionella israelensis]QBS09866.1 glycine dehydrogenase subunit 2 [Legionella israelensis]SCY18037.1 glycine dehydrogenase subunit 2 [Legionella israelensis DSM 19235]STX59427.1 glycine dehydrogenase [decarboxylating] subunit 2 (glycine decarboxylase) (glycine cleavage system P-protein) [Legionella israelensis]